MNTEITEYKLNGWVLYDGDCRLCVGMARRFQHLLATRHLGLLPLQTPWVKARLRLLDSQLLAEMRLMRTDGTSLGGADALVEIARHFWWAWPLGQLGRVPSVAKILRAGYRWVARHRDCINGACEVKSQGDQSRLFDFLPLQVLPLTALILRTHLPAWIFMWAMAFALYAGCKWLTYREARRHGMKPGIWRTLAYLVAWPGMDANGFFGARKVSTKPLQKEWLFALAKTFFGVVLTWKIVRLLVPHFPIAAGWTGMVGIVFVLHFGLFHTLSLIWRRRGIAATPLMQNPICSKSVAEFWGKRWNTAFHELAFRFTFRPLRKRTTPGVAALLVFGLSGLIHELVISLPARGGYGLPTLYFLIQGMGTIAERSQLGRSIRLGRGARGWFFTFFITVAPVFWLFHPPFIKNVILPMLTAIGAT